MLLMNDGTIKACGANSEGQLGLNDLVDRKVFTNVPNITGIKQIACGNSHTMLLMNDGTIRVCGSNGQGQLGLNDLVTKTVFASVPNITGVKQISCGYFHSLLLMDVGNIKACGYNPYGQLGLNDLVARKVFTDVPNILFPDNTVYLIKKKTDDINLYNIDINTDTLINSCTTISLLNFNNGFKLLESLSIESQYGKPIDKLNTFSLYKTGSSSNASLFE